MHIPTTDLYKSSTTNQLKSQIERANILSQAKYRRVEIHRLVKAPKILSITSAVQRSQHHLRRQLRSANIEASSHDLSLTEIYHDYTNL